MIELNNFTYKTNRILFEGANFIAPSIGIIGIAGESGCGKTTFLKIISKQIHLDSMVNNATSIFYGNQDALLKKDHTIAHNGVNLRSWLFFIAFFPIISVYL